MVEKYGYGIWIFVIHRKDSRVKKVVKKRVSKILARDEGRFGKVWTQPGYLFRMYNDFTKNNVHGDFWVPMNVRLIFFLTKHIL